MGLPIATAFQIENYVVTNASRLKTAAQGNTDFADRKVTNYEFQVSYDRSPKQARSAVFNSFILVSDRNRQKLQPIRSCHAYDLGCSNFTFGFSTFDVLAFYTVTYSPLSFISTYFYLHLSMLLVSSGNR